MFYEIYRERERDAVVCSMRATSWAMQTERRHQSERAAPHGSAHHTFSLEHQRRNHLPAHPSTHRSNELLSCAAGTRQVTWIKSSTFFVMHSQFGW